MLSMTWATLNSICVKIQSLYASVRMNKRFCNNNNCRLYGKGVKTNLGGSLQLFWLSLFRCVTHIWIICLLICIPYNKTACICKYRFGSQTGEQSGGDTTEWTCFAPTRRPTPTGPPLQGPPRLLPRLRRPRRFHNSRPFLQSQWHPVPEPPRWRSLNSITWRRPWRQRLWRWPARPPSIRPTSWPTRRRQLPWWWQLGNRANSCLNFHRRIWNHK